jgi:hypothetical protein
VAGPPRALPRGAAALARWCEHEPDLAGLADLGEVFELHFAKRKIAIGDCMRAYGTNCAHEYACEQRRLARPDPDARPRLQRTRDGLVEQLDEARRRGWLGEIERLQPILAAVDDKLEELQRAQRRVNTIELTVSPARCAKLST